MVVVTYEGFFLRLVKSLGVLIVCVHIQNIQYISVGSITLVDSQQIEYFEILIKF